ncbi:MAG: hypothetical protein ACQEQO_03295 [Thermodesulfobacteriota bacterium]
MGNNTNGNQFREDGYTGGTRFEIEYAMILEILVVVHSVYGASRMAYQHLFPCIEKKQELFLAWEAFFRKIYPESG